MVARLRVCGLPSGIALAPLVGSMHGCHACAADESPLQSHAEAAGGPPDAVARSAPCCHDCHISVEQGRLVRDGRLAAIATRCLVTPAQVALAYTLRRDRAIAIPKARTVEHVRENRAAADLVLAEGELDAPAVSFPPPRGRQLLEML